MSSSTTTSQDVSEQQILSHFVSQKIRENGGPVDLDDVAYSVGDVGDIEPNNARDLIEQGEQSGIYTIDRGSSHGRQIANVDPIGAEPAVISEAFGTRNYDGSNFVVLDGVTPSVADALRDEGFTSFEELADADPAALVDPINTTLDATAEVADFEDQTALTTSEIRDLQSQGITTKRDLARADPLEVQNEGGSTLTAAKVQRAQKQVAGDVTIFDEEAVAAITDKAHQQIPVGKSLAAAHVKRHQERKANLGQPGAIVRKVEEETNRVGEPLLDVRADLDENDPEAVYFSDVGHNSDNPVNTGLPVLEDVGYDKVPKLETDPDAGHSALPVDEDGNVVPPTIPLERDLQMPIDELVAKKLARNVPVRIVGPRGSGKNYLTKYLCYRTNRGYRSLDVDKATMPQDLFGPISPNKDGVLEPKNADVKQGLLNGDVIVINEFPVMQAGAAMALHQLLNENKIIIKSHGEELEPHPEARIVVTMNPPTREYRDSEPMNSATRGRFRGFWQGYPDTVDGEVETLDQQLNTPKQVVDPDTLEKIVEFAHRTRKDEFVGWPTLSTRNLTIVCEHIADGASPKAALKNVLRMVAEPNQHVEDAFEALGEVF